MSGSEHTGNGVLPEHPGARTHSDQLPLERARLYHITSVGSLGLVEMGEYLLLRSTPWSQRNQGDRHTYQHVSQFGYFFALEGLVWSAQVAV
jgi:hypothetical protein